MHGLGAIFCCGTDMQFTTGVCALSALVNGLEVPVNECHVQRPRCESLLLLAIRFSHLLHMYDKFVPYFFRL